MQCRARALQQTWDRARSPSATPPFRKPHLFCNALCNHLVEALHGLECCVLARYARICLARAHAARCTREDALRARRVCSWDLFVQELGPSIMLETYSISTQVTALTSGVDTEAELYACTCARICMFAAVAYLQMSTLRNMVSCSWTPMMSHFH
jgi:hypothetical protein